MTLPRPGDTVSYTTPDGRRTTTIVLFHAIPPVPSGGVAWMVACEADSQHMCVVELDTTPRTFHHPWDLTWEGTADQDTPDNPHAARPVEGGAFTSLHGLSHPEVFARFATHTAHTRLRIQTWLAETAARIAHRSPA